MASCVRRVHKTMCEHADGTRVGKYGSVVYKSVPKGKYVAPKTKTATKTKTVKKKAVAKTVKKTKTPKTDANIELLKKWYSSRGSDITTSEEFVMSMSLEHHYMSPSEAKAKLKELLDKGYLEKKGGFIRPTARVYGRIRS